MSTSPDFETRELKDDNGNEWPAVGTTEPDLRETPDGFRAETEYGLTKELKDAKSCMSELELAHVIAEALGEDLYLKDLVGQLQFIADGVTIQQNQEEVLPF